jgi:hypothetical protein
MDNSLTPRRSGRKRKTVNDLNYDWNSDQEEKNQRRKLSSPQPQPTVSSQNHVPEKKTPRKQKLVLAPLQQMEPVIESFSPNKKKNLPPKLVKIFLFTFQEKQKDWTFKVRVLSNFNKPVTKLTLK